MISIEERFYNDRLVKFCNLSENISEALIRSYDVKSVENDLKSRFGNVVCVLNHASSFYKLPMYKPKDNNMGNFEIVLSSFDSLNEIVQTIEKSYGWFLMAVCLNKNIFFIDWDRNGTYQKANNPHENMDMFYYVSKYLNGSLNAISIFVEAKFTVEDFYIRELYHKTSRKNLRKITKNGLTPKTEGNFPERIYFGKNIYDIENMIGGKFSGGDGVLLRLNFDDFGDEIRDKYVFYKDPRSETSVFTYDCINPKYIQVLQNNKWSDLI